MFLVVGLGNPGEEYAKTRHNIGFMAADEIHSRYNFSPFKAKFEGLLAEGTIDGEKVLLLKPQTFMNLSGNSVGKVANFYKISPKNIIVIHDDKDLTLGKLKAKIGGSAGGHNGLKNISELLGNENYARLRFGIGNAFQKGGQIDYVLGEWTPEEKNQMEERITICCEIIKSFCLAGLQRTMNQYNQK